MLQSQANMTLSEFEGAVLKDGFYGFESPETSGPACIVVRAELTKEFHSYIFLQNKLTGVSITKVDPVFIAWTGSKMFSSMVNSFWGKSVGHSSVRPRIFGALVRKSAVSKVHQQVQ